MLRGVIHLYKTTVPRARSTKGKGVNSNHKATAARMFIQDQWIPQQPMKPRRNSHDMIISLMCPPTTCHQHTQITTSAVGIADDFENLRFGELSACLLRRRSPPTQNPQDNKNMKTPQRFSTHPGTNVETYNFMLYYPSALFKQNTPANTSPSMAYDTTQHPLVFSLTFGLSNISNIAWSICLMVVLGAHPLSSSRMLPAEAQSTQAHKITKSVLQHACKWQTYGRGLTDERSQQTQVEQQACHLCLREKHRVAEGMQDTPLKTLDARGGRGQWLVRT